MYCPKCREVLQHSRGTYKCLRGDMELSRNLADQLSACFVAKTEEPGEAVTFKVGGQWFCPGCGIALKVEIPGTASCPQCGRTIGRSLMFQLVELHPHF
jgi:hypothetical protein